MPPILIHEVGLRDGLQMERTVVPTSRKLSWIEAILRSGLDVIQVGSFVRPEKVPQMADTDALFAHLGSPGRRPAGVVLSALVLNEKGLERGLLCGADMFCMGVSLNEKGLERGLLCGADMFCMGVSASETHSRRNTGMGIAEATGRIVTMAGRALAAGKRAQVSVQSAFGCGYEGRVPRERVLAIVQAFVDAGLRQLSLADTAGHATPDDVEALYAEVRRVAPSAELACHFHDTYGLALANCYAALRVGVTSFEASVAGLGGCPFTAVAGGNTCTEDFVHALQRSGRRLDIKLDPLLEVARDVASFFGRDLPGAVYKTGPVAEPQEVG